MAIQEHANADQAVVEEQQENGIADYRSRIERGHNGNGEGEGSCENC